MTKMQKLRAMAEKLGTWADDEDQNEIVAKIRKVAGNMGVDPEPELNEILAGDDE